MTWRLAFAVVVLVSLYSLFSPASGLPDGIEVNDKLEHGSLFLLLALTGLGAGLPAGWLVVGLVAYAGVSEVLQAVLPIHRDGDPLDVLADVVGVALGVLLWRVGGALVRRRTTRRAAG